MSRLGLLGEASTVPWPLPFMSESAFVVPSSQQPVQWTGPCWFLAEC